MRASLSLLKHNGLRLKPSDYRSSGLSYAVHAIAGHPPLYMGEQATPQSGDRVGYRFVNERTRSCLLYFPGLAQLDELVHELLPQCDALLLDGTFWSEHEMEKMGIGTRGASEMGHLPVGGPKGSLAQIAPFPIKRRIYVHINNTNPMLIEGSPEQRAVLQAGIEIGKDGMEFTL